MLRLAIVVDGVGKACDAVPKPGEPSKPSEAKQRYVSMKQVV